MNGSHVVLAGSERKAIPDGIIIGPADPAERIRVAVVVRRKEERPPIDASRRVMAHEELVANHGATATDLLAVRDFAKQYSLQVVASSVATRTVALAGTVGDFSRAFEVTLDKVQVGSETFRQRMGSLAVPKDLAGIIVAVLGLDNRPQAEPRYRSADASALRRHAGVHPLSPVEVAKLYNFPPGDGSGQTIAIIELGGGFAQDDLNTYFRELRLPVPTVTAVSIVGQGNNPGVDPQADGQVMLDIEVAGAVAPGAHERVYFAPNTDQGFLAAVHAAIHDNPTSLPAAISIGYGNPESEWTGQSMSAFEAAFQDAAKLGIPVCVASGDDGSSDGATGLNADFPASAPHALGCGGTLLQGAGGTISSEVVWNGGTSGGATGGGFSSQFARPFYQATVHVHGPTGSTSGRGVPDVAGNAADGSPYKVRISGVDTVAWGTSAVASLWTGLIARLSQSLRRKVGFLQPVIYQSSVGSADFFDITQGNNDESGAGGPYFAGPGWDPCTGLGSPNGAALLKTLAIAASAHGRRPAHRRPPAHGRPTPLPTPAVPPVFAFATDWSMHETLESSDLTVLSVSEVVAGRVSMRLLVPGRPSERTEVGTRELGVPFTLREAREFARERADSRLPERLVNWLRDRLDDMQGGRHLWLDLRGPRGNLPLVPWERLLGNASSRSVMRLPRFALVPASSPERFEAVYCLCGSRDVFAKIRELQTTLGSLAPIPVGEKQIIIHIFMDARFRQSYAAPDREQRFGETIVARFYDPTDLPDSPAEEGPEGGIDNPWLRWIADSLDDRAVDLVHFCCDALVDGDQGGLALAGPKSPQLADALFSPVVRRERLEKFLTRVGARAAGFSAPPDGRSILGMRLLANDLARSRPGIVYVHDMDEDPANFQFERFVQTDLFKPSGRTSAYPAICSFAPPDSTTDRDAGRVNYIGGLLESYTVARDGSLAWIDGGDKLPGWATAAQRYLERCVARRLERSPRSERERSAREGVEYALRETSRAIERYFEGGRGEGGRLD
jgi:kumamolisin